MPVTERYCRDAGEKGKQYEYTPQRPGGVLHCQPPICDYMEGGADNENPRESLVNGLGQGKIDIEKERDAGET
jgi:hypothetical protein